MRFLIVEDFPPALLGELLRSEREREGGGRPPGSGSFRADDELLVEEALTLFAGGEARSVTQVVRRLYDQDPMRFVGGGTEESRIDRIVRSVNKRRNAEK